VAGLSKQAKEVNHDHQRELRRKRVSRRRWAVHAPPINSSNPTQDARLRGGGRPEAQIHATRRTHVELRNRLLSRVSTARRHNTNCCF